MIKLTELEESFETRDDLFFYWLFLLFKSLLEDL